MNMSPFRATFAVIFALTTRSLASPSSAQQKAAPLQQSPALSQPAAPSAAVPSAPTQAASDATVTPDGSRSLKSTTVALRALSPWSMFVSADILVKAVMVGRALAPVGALSNSHAKHVATVADPAQFAP